MPYSRKTVTSTRQCYHSIWTNYLHRKIYCQHYVFSDAKQTNKSRKQERQATNNETTTKKGNSCQATNLWRNRLGNWVILIFSGQKPCTTILPPCKTITELFVTFLKGYRRNLVNCDNTQKNFLWEPEKINVRFHKMTTCTWNFLNFIWRDSQSLWNLLFLGLPLNSLLFGVITDN